MVQLNLKEVNEELDTILVRQLTLIQEYCSLSGELSTIMSRGFVQIAKSRMVLGQAPLSPSTEDSAEALLTVTREGRNQVPSEESNDKSATLCYSIPEEEQKKYLAKLRHRIGGFMSPGSLSVAQERFVAALERSIELVNVQQELIRASERYSELMTTKQQLMIGNVEQ